MTVLSSADDRTPIRIIRRDEESIICVTDAFTDEAVNEHINVDGVGCFNGSRYHCRPFISCEKATSLEVSAELPERLHLGQHCYPN